ncbi:DUF805 domain-containing protein [Deefgea sp. CFH1-16]|uniref:DUF805 domain-containing protein n=1 Tax=Deefgea sp. CFH1-16 TaxID=2675457 RepID=UPI0015F391A9|nr:DUF805 domain-containing protein [Deefgea sp. CFH1-16]MBM5575555.1 DUF805 domain-containing protein [Deefgea sp. CFH1-16]
MKFEESIRTCFSKYADFKGRAVRSEYWWWVLFTFLAGVALSLAGETVSGVFSLLTLLPSLAVGARRLHDTNRSGWWQLIWFLPIIGWILLLYWFASEGVEPNRFD